MSPDDLLRLAPDPKTLESGRRLFYSKRWQLLGGDGEWLWGEFTFGQNRYIKTATGLTEARFSCSCRAKSRPCAHNLALILIFKNQPDRLTVGQPPSWVRSVQFRATAPPKATQDTVAAGDRQAARLEQMTDGIDELELRLLDIARRGTADVMAQGPEVWLSLAGRLTDAKLSGLAGRVRGLAALEDDFDKRRIVRTLGDLYLFVRAWRRLDDSPPDRRRQLLQLAGLTVRKDELFLQPKVDDHWLVLGSLTKQEEALSSRRVWLRGERSRRFALLLDFAYGLAPFEQSWPVGATFDGALTYYPGSYPQRAILPSPRPGGRPYDGLKGYTLIAEMLDNYRRALIAQPWLLQYPVYFERLRPLRSQQGQFLVDGEGQGLHLRGDRDLLLRLLAVGGAAGAGVFGEYDGEGLTVLSLVAASGIRAV